MCAATAVVSTDFLSSTPTAASTVETPENTKNYPAPADGDIKIEYSSD